MLFDQKFYASSSAILAWVQRTRIKVDRPHRLIRQIYYTERSQLVSHVSPSIHADEIALALSPVDGSAPIDFKSTNFHRFPSYAYSPESLTPLSTTYVPYDPPSNARMLRSKWLDWRLRLIDNGLTLRG